MKQKVVFNMNVNYRIGFIAAYRALLRNKLRSMLTSIGIIIGISSVIAMISLGNSAKIAILDQIFSYGKNGILFELKDPREVTSKDLEKLKSRISQIELISPADYQGGNTAQALHKYREKTMRAKIQFANEDYFEINQRYAQSGRVFTKEEVDQKSKVAVIGTAIKNEMFSPGEEVLGKKIWIHNTSYEVIGILDEKGEALSGREFDRITILPYTTGLQRIKGTDKFHRIMISAESEESIPAVIQGVETYMQQRFQIVNNPEEYYSFSTSEDKLKMAKDITGALTILLSGIAAISLFVGGVGIMNIMLVSVTERTREIGIRMAIGAKKIDIMIQFLLESVMLSCFGGSIGIVIGLCVYTLIVLLVEWPFVFSLSAVLLAVIFAAAVGIFFGFYPSRQAAQLKPIEALRYE